MNVQNFVKNFKYHMYPGFDGTISKCSLKTVEINGFFFYLNIYHVALSNIGAI